MSRNLQIHVLFINEYKLFSRFRIKGKPRHAQDPRDFIRSMRYRLHKHEITT